jgi:hypothetical protein
MKTAERKPTGPPSDTESHSLPNKSKAGQELLHVHVPRTAGLAISRIIGRPDGFDQRITHWTAQQWREAMGSERYDAAFSFAVVRDPRDRLLSAYSYLRQQTPENVARPEYYEYDAIERKFLSQYESFEEFVLKMPRTISKAPQFQHFLTQASLLASQEGACLVSKLFRYEELTDAIRQLSECVGGSLELPQFNRSTHEHWRALFTEGMDIRVREIYWPDFALLGYE